MRRLERLGILVILGLLLGVWSSRTVGAQVVFAEVSYDYNTSGDHTVIAAVTAQTIRVYQLTLFCDAANTVIIKDSTPTTLHPAITFSGEAKGFFDANTRGTEGNDRGIPWFTTASGKGLVINLGQAARCSGKLFYTQG